MSGTGIQAAREGAREMAAQMGHEVSPGEVQTTEAGAEVFLASCIRCGGSVSVPRDGWAHGPALVQEWQRQRLPDAWRRDP